MPVYFIKASDSGRIKIGHSENPIARMAILQAHSVEKLQLVRVIKGDHNLEKFIHDVCKSSKIRGEWYRPTKEVLRIINNGNEIAFLKSKKDRVESMKPKDIKKLRERLGLAQADLGKLVGANQATVSKWETGAIAVSRMASRALEQVDQLATKWDARKALKRLDQEAA